MVGLESNIKELFSNMKYGPKFFLCPSRWVMEVQTADIQLLMSDNVEDLGFNVVNEFTTRIETKSQCNPVLNSMNIRSEC